jgi:hypothetical protein
MEKPVEARAVAPGYARVRESLLIVDLASARKTGDAGETLLLFQRGELPAYCSTYD